MSIRWINQRVHSGLGIYGVQGSKIKAGREETKDGLVLNSQVHTPKVVCAHVCLCVGVMSRKDTVGHTAPSGGHCGASADCCAGEETQCWGICLTCAWCSTAKSSAQFPTWLVCVSAPAPWLVLYSCPVLCD